MATRKMLERDRKDGLRGVDPDCRTQDGEFDQDGSPASSPTTPFAFNGSPARRSSFVRSQSLNGRIQKPSVARSQSFNLPHRSYHMDTLQAQLLYMKAKGVDQQKFMNVLEKLKDMYLSRGEQQQQQEDRRTPRHSLPSSPLSNNSQTPSSPLSNSYQMPSSPLSNNQMPSSPLSNHQVTTSSPLSSYQMNSSPLSTSSHTFPPRLEDGRPPAEASTIALLKNKFAQLERYKESIQGQQIQVYPNQTFRSGHSSAQRTPVSSTPCSPGVGFEDSYYFDEGTAALLAVQQELMMSNSSRSAAAAAAASGISEDALNSEQSMGSRSPGWSACDSPASGSVSPQSDEAASALLHYVLQPQNVSQMSPHSSNLNAFQSASLAVGVSSNLHAFQNMSLGGGGGGGAAAAMGNSNAASGGMTDSLGGLLAAERIMEIKMLAKKAAAAEINNVPHHQTKLACSIQQVVAKFPFNLTAKFSSPKSKLPGASWGESLSLNTLPPPPVMSSPDDYSSERSWESESPSSQTDCRNGPDFQWYNSSRRECSSDMYTKQQQEFVDTSLHL